MVNNPLVRDQDVILSEEFGRTFWLNDVDELCSAPTFKNGETHWEQWDYVSDWTDLDGINLDSLLDIHKKLVLKNHTETTKEQLLVLMNTIDFAQDNDASYEEYTIIKSGTPDLDEIREILYNKYIQQGGK